MPINYLSSMYTNMEDIRDMDKMVKITMLHFDVSEDVLMLWTELVGWCKNYTEKYTQKFSMPVRRPRYMKLIGTQKVVKEIYTLLKEDKDKFPFLLKKLNDLRFELDMCLARQCENFLNEENTTHI